MRLSSTIVIFHFTKSYRIKKNRVGCIRSRLVTPCHKWRRPQICNITIYEYQISKVFSELKIFLWCKYAEKNDKFHKLLKLHKDIKFLLQKYIGEVDWKLHIEYYFNINPIWPEVLDPGKHLGGLSGLLISSSINVDRCTDYGGN